MAISFVNGFLCTSSCDVSKAKQGVDPHPKLDELQNSAKPDATKNETASGKDATDAGRGDPGWLTQRRVRGGGRFACSCRPSPVAARIQAQGQIVNLLV